MFVVHHSHLDIGYTDPQGTVLRHHLDYLDAALRLAERTDAWPDDARFRWTVESSMPALQWLDARPADQVAEFVALARDGRHRGDRAAVPAAHRGVLHRGAYRLLRFTAELREQYGIATKSAMHTDVPGAVVGVIDALNAAGVRYLAAAHNWAGRSVPYLHGGDKLTRPFRWRAPSGQEVLVWFTDTPHGMAYMEGNTVGLADSYELADDLLPRYLSALAIAPATPTARHVRLAGCRTRRASRTSWTCCTCGCRARTPTTPGRRSCRPRSRASGTSEWAYPRLRLRDQHATSSSTCEERSATGSAVHEGDWTDWWADGLGSGARPARLRTGGRRHACAPPDAARLATR